MQLNVEPGMKQLSRIICLLSCQLNCLETYNCVVGPDLTDFEDIVRFWAVVIYNFM